MLIIGLTGGIGSGKSTVADLFAKQGVPIIDMDVIAHEIVEPGQTALAEIAATFGQDYILDSGRLNRVKLRETIFLDNEKRKQLEAILHPRIRDMVRERLSTLTAPYVIIVIPLLLETEQQDLIDRILVIDAAEEDQIHRTMIRDGNSEGMARKILASQIDRQSRLDAADDIIHNSNGLDELNKQVETLHRYYLKIAT